MFIDTEAAKSDFILAASAYLFLPMAVTGLLYSLPFYPGGMTRVMLGLAWIGLAGAASPILLARYRGDVARAFPLKDAGSWLPRGLLLTIPVVATSLARALPVPDLNVGFALLGRLGPYGQPNPTIAGTGLLAIQVLLGVLVVTVLAAASVALLVFLSSRAADGFRGTEIGLTEGLRTFGVGAAAVGLVTGLLNTFRDGLVIGWQTAVINSAGLLLMVLLADQLIPARGRTTRATIIAPLVVVAGAFLLTAGGVLRGDPLFALYPGSLAGGTMVVVACLVAADRAGAAVPLVVATTVYPTCMTPLLPLLQLVAPPFASLAGCT